MKNMYHLVEDIHVGAHQFQSFVQVFYCDCVVYKRLKQHFWKIDKRVGDNVKGFEAQLRPLDILFLLKKMGMLYRQMDKESDSDPCGSGKTYENR